LKPECTPEITSDSAIQSLRSEDNTFTLLQLCSKTIKCN